MVNARRPVGSRSVEMAAGRSRLHALIETAIIAQGIGILIGGCDEGVDKEIIDFLWAPL